MEVLDDICLQKLTLFGQSLQNLSDPKEDCLYLVCLVEVFVGVLAGQKFIVVHN